MRGSARRGQALVEFAVILPLLALMLVMALDFGRVFFGWVGLHNAVRIGADYAAANANAWDGNPAPLQGKRDRYQELIVNDLQSLNCTLPSPDPVPDPAFSGFEDGDLVQAEVSCAFELLTPLAEGLFGGPINMTVRTDFAIHKPLVGGLPAPGGGGGGPPPPPPPCAAPTALISTNPAEGSGGRVQINTGQSVTFTDASTVGGSCPITTWLWNFGNGNTATTVGPHTQTYTNPGPAANRDFTVSLTVTNTSGSSTDTVIVRVRR